MTASRGDRRKSDGMARPPPSRHNCRAARRLRLPPQTSTVTDRPCLLPMSAASAVRPAAAPAQLIHAPASCSDHPTRLNYRPAADSPAHKGWIDSVRLLLVEDSPRLQRSLSTGLRREGYAVDVAGDGGEGL